MKQVVGFCVVLALWVSVHASLAVAADTGWMQRGVRVWYFGAVGSSSSSDAAEAYLFSAVNGTDVQVTKHAGMNHWSRAGGIERAGTASATRAGATCFIGSGDGMGARRTGTATPPGCVDRAGVEARARTTGVLVRDAAFAGFFDWVLALRALGRALPFRCDAAAFNCFPLFGLWPRRTRVNTVDSSHPPTDSNCSRRTRPVQPFFRQAIQNPESRIRQPPKSLLRIPLRPNRTIGSLRA